MWVLFVISTVMEYDVKFTRYDEYQSAMGCSIEQAVLQASFQEDEEAFCLNTTIRKVIK